MTDVCAQHRPYLAAIADGEMDYVPTPATAHVRACAACAAEVELHGQLGEKLRNGLASGLQVGTVQTSQRRGARILAAASAAVAVAASAVVVAVHGGGAPRPVPSDQAIQLAASVARAQPALRTGDAVSLSAWCAEHSGRPAPPVSIIDGTLLGARTDAGPDAAIVTVYYRAPSGRVAISWLDTHPTSQRPLGITERQESGNTVLVVNAPDGLAVVSGDATTSALWTAAHSLELDRHGDAASPAADRPLEGGA